MDDETGTAEREAERQDALIVEIASLAREFAKRFTTKGVKDLTQDVVLECLTLLREDRWPDTESLPSLINSIVKRRVLNRDKRARRRAAREEGYDPELEPADPAWVSPLQTLENEEVMAACSAALRRLPRAPELVYTIIRRDGVSPAEAAVRLGISPHAVRAHLRRAERAIRAELLALGLMPEGTQARTDVLLKAKADVPTVLKRRAQGGRRVERANERR
jgi:RNA polymerase sigma factor (sigma-70 family)